MYAYSSAMSSYRHAYPDANLIAGRIGYQTKPEKRHQQATATELAKSVSIGTVPPQNPYAAARFLSRRCLPPPLLLSMGVVALVWSVSDAFCYPVGLWALVPVGTHA